MAFAAAALFFWVRGFVWVISGNLGARQGRQSAHEDFEMEAILVTQPVAAALDDSDLVVEAFDEPERRLVLGFAVGRDARPVALDQRGELLERLEPLPALRGAPLLEELAGPGLASALPQLIELLLQGIRGIESLVRREMAQHVNLVVADRRLGAHSSVTVRKGFHMSITASRKRLLRGAPRES